MPEIQLLRVNQWLESWDLASWSPQDDLPEPPKVFYLGSMPIATLRKLAGVYTRTKDQRKQAGAKAGYQRAHQPERSKSILRYLHYGYPLSTQGGLDPQDHRDLIKPGWLPTAILVNVLKRGETRPRGSKNVEVPDDLIVEIAATEGGERLVYPDPDSARFGGEFLEPLEVIDGQHRLYAAEHDPHLGDDYEVPVVFFHGLSPSWQAYLFWVINVEPKKINTSLAFDLYPELRNQNWLERGEWIRVYQEHRSQELTETLWRHPKSPWRDRIELHGARVDGHVSNAAFIRSLMSSFVRKWGSESKIGGLFGSLDREGHQYVLRWKRSQQAAFLIRLWDAFHAAVQRSASDWVLACENSYSTLDPASKKKSNPHRLHPAFAGPHTLLGTDQGVRAILAIANALCQVRYDELGLADWVSDVASDAPEEADVSDLLKELGEKEEVNRFLDALAIALVDGGLDWRTSSEPSLNADERQMQSSYRGSSGYTLLQKNAFGCLVGATEPEIAEAAKQVVELLGWSSDEHVRDLF